MEMLQFFVGQEKGNGLFQTVFKTHASGAKTSGRAAQWTTVVNSVSNLTCKSINDILTGDAALSELHNVIKYFQRPNVNVEEDIQHIESSPIVKERNQRAGTRQLLESAMKIMQYIAHLEDVVQTLEVFEVVEQDDADFKIVHALKDNLGQNEDLRLKQLPGKSLSPTLSCFIH
jgi:hypothetical protein